MAGSPGAGEEQVSGPLIKLMASMGGQERAKGSKETAQNPSRAYINMN